MTTHLRARAAQAGAFLALVGGFLAVASAPALADQPQVQITSMSSTDLPAGGRTTMSYSITNVSQGGGGPDLIRVQVSGMACSGDCTPMTQIKAGETKEFTAQLTAPQVAAGQTKTVQVQITAQQNGDAGQASQSVTVHGADKPTTVRQITGRVKDQNGRAVPGATVGIRDSQGHSYTTTTTNDGRFQFTSSDQAPILAGPLSVGAAKQGYPPVTVSVQGTADRVINVPLTLKGGLVAPSTAPSSVIVSAPPTDDVPSDEASAPAAAASDAAKNASSSSGSGSMLYIILGALLVAAGIGAIVLLLMRRKNNGGDSGDRAGYGAGGGGYVPPSRGAYNDATRVGGVGAAMGGGNDATMIANRSPMSDAPTMMHQAVPADEEFPDPYGAPLPQGGYGATTQYGGAGGQYGAATQQYAPSGDYDAGPPTQFGQPSAEDQSPYGAYGSAGGYGGGTQQQRYDEPTGMYRPESSGYEDNSGSSYGGTYGGGSSYGSGGYSGQSGSYSGGTYGGSWGAESGGASTGGGDYGAPSSDAGRGGSEYGERDYGSGQSGTYGGGHSGTYGSGQSGSHGGGTYGGGYDERGGYDQRGGGYDQSGYDQRGTSGGSYNGSEQGESYDDRGYYGGGEQGGGRHGGQSHPPESSRPGQRRPLDWLDD